MNMKKPKDSLTAPSKSRHEKNRSATVQTTQELSPLSKKKRDQIIEAALDTFLELGYEGASMNLVAERAGVIKQTIYSHFQDKQSLFREVIASLTVDYVQSALQKPELVDKPLPVVLRTIAETILARHQDPRHIQFVRTMIGEAGRFPELAKLFADATVRPALSIIVQRITRQDVYKIKDPEAFARVFIGSIVHHCLQQYILHGKELLPFDSTRLVDELVDILELHRS
jgi:AcrR family transcriptional regulator